MPPRTTAAPRAVPAQPATGAGRWVATAAQGASIASSSSSSSRLCRCRGRSTGAPGCWGGQEGLGAAVDEQGSSPGRRVAASCSAARQHMQHQSRAQRIASRSYGGEPGSGSATVAGTGGSPQ
ncbi:MAG: hypothetical protein WDW36_008236 [Sanguina aurantia]